MTAKKRDYAHRAYQLKVASQRWREVPLAFGSPKIQLRSLCRLLFEKTKRL